LGADAQVKILTQQISDEKYQLEERQGFEEELRKKQLEAQNEEVKQLTKYIAAEYDAHGKAIEFSLTEDQINDLIAEKDAVRLAKKIKATKLSQAQQEELAKVILEAQTNEITYNDQLAKFEDERIKREQVILRLNREIAIIKQQGTLESIQELEAKRQEILNESNTKILQNDNAFNRKLLAQRKQAAVANQVIVEQEYSYKNDLLERQYEIDKTAIENSVYDEQTKAKELEKLQVKYYQDQEKLEREHNNKMEALQKQELEEKRKIAIRQAEIVNDALLKTTQAFQTELTNKQNVQTGNVAKMIEKTTAAVAQQQDLAARGLANSLAYQQAQLEKQQLQQQDLAKRQQKQQQAVALAEALMNAYNAELKQPDANPTTAAVKALGDVLLFKGLAAGLVQFAADGNDDVKGPGTTTSDSIPFMLSKHEGVVKASANIDNPGVVASLNSDTFDQMYMPKYNLRDTSNTGQNIYDSMLLQSNKEIISLLRDIKSKPVPHWNIDEFGNLMETMYYDGMKTVTQIKNKRKRI
jgi:hypothetical protein